MSSRRIYQAIGATPESARKVIEAIGPLSLPIANGVTLRFGDAISVVAGRATLSDARSVSPVRGYIGQCISGGTGDVAGSVYANIAVEGIAPASGLTPGQSVYLSTSSVGSVSTVDPNTINAGIGLGATYQRVGVAISASEFLIQVGKPESVDWCSPLDIPTNGIFYGKADSSNVLQSSRLFTVADLFGTGRTLVRDGGLSSAPLFEADKGPGGASACWYFQRSQSQRMQILDDVGMTGLVWSGVVINLLLGTTVGEQMLVSKSFSSIADPFSFSYSTPSSLKFETGASSSWLRTQWKMDGFTRQGENLPYQLFSRGQSIGSVLGLSQSSSPGSIYLGNDGNYTTSLEGRIAAIALWNRVLSPEEHLGLNNWAKRVWGVAVS